MKELERHGGGNTQSLHYEKALELLGDGEWHDYHRVLSAVTAAVSPARGYRCARMRRKWDPVDDDERQRMVRTGQRAIARTTLSRRERFEVRDSPDGTRQIRFLGYQVRTPEERSASARKGHETLGAEGRSQRSRKAAASTPAEVRSERSLKGWATRRDRSS